MSCPPDHTFRAKEGGRRESRQAERGERKMKRVGEKEGSMGEIGGELGR